MSAVPRLIRAVTSGQYRGVTLARLGMIAAGVAYIVSPIDLMPEGFLAVFGLADDALVLGWVASALINETETFLAWERGRGPATTAYAYEQARYGGGVQDAPVHGSVIR